MTYPDAIDQGAVSRVRIAKKISSGFPCQSSVVIGGEGIGEADGAFFVPAQFKFWLIKGDGPYKLALPYQETGSRRGTENHVEYALRGLLGLQ